MPRQTLVPLDQVLSVRLSKEELTALRTLAKKGHITPSSLVRAVVLRALAQSAD